MQSQKIALHKWQTNPIFTSATNGSQNVDAFLSGELAGARDAQTQFAECLMQVPVRSALKVEESSPEGLDLLQAILAQKIQFNQ